MIAKFLIWVLAIFLLPTASLAEAQQPKRVPRIGYLAADPQGPTRDSFRQGLKDLGYIEGQTIIIEWRFAEDNSNRFPELAEELIRLKVDVFVAANAAALGALKQATTTILIVMTTYGGDPVADGFVNSFARPGKNITGLTPLDPELNGKQTELLKETIPRLSRLAVLWNPRDSGASRQWHETESAATALKIQLLSLEARTSEEVKKAFESAMQRRVDALSVLRSSLFYSGRKQIASLAEKNRLPGMYPAKEYVDAGGLMSYAADNHALYRRAAAFVDKILKGAKAADLPLEAPTRFELVINLKTAKQIGLTIPPNVLARADRVIK